MGHGKTFHVFISHNSNDKLAVEEIAQKLMAVGLEPWIDKWNLVPGDPWQPAIEEALRDSATCAVCVGPSGLGAWQHEEMRAAIARRVASQQSDQRFRVIPVLLPGAVRGDRLQLPEFLTATTWVEFSQTLDDETTFRILERAIRGLAPGPSQPVAIKKCPYRGLEFFDVSDAPLFFGRAAITGWLLSALRGSLSKEGPTRFLAMVGASGSGKSSLARAGLISALRNGGIEGSENWLTTICRPGANPLQSLSLALAKTDGIHLGTGLVSDLVEDMILAFKKRPNALDQMTRASLGDSFPHRRLVVLVDQFEELFTVCTNDADRQAFVDNLLFSARVPQGQTIVLLTMRVDFYGKCADHQELNAAISGHHFLVGPMTAEELREAIERPAQCTSCEIEPGLVGLLLHEVQRRPGALPMLQYGLLRMWTNRTGRRITTADYDAVGHLEGIIEKRVEGVFNRFTESQQEICRRLFIRLTEPGEGTEDTSRRARWNELTSAQHDVVRTLADERLLRIDGTMSSADDSVVEIAHETLIQSWSRLRGWIEDSRAGLRAYRHIIEQSREWDAAIKSMQIVDAKGLLFRKPRLDDALNFRKDYPGLLSELEEKFLEESVAQQNRERKQLERLEELEAKFAEQQMLQLAELSDTAKSSDPWLDRILPESVLGFDFFISYSWNDSRDYAIRLTEELKSRGFKCWLDSVNFAIGDNWRQKGRQAATRSKSMILIATNGAIRSEPIKREMEIFQEMKKPILPIVFGSYQSEDYPLSDRIGPDVLQLRESLAALKSGPTPQAIHQLTRSIKIHSRKRTGLRILLAAVAIATIALSIGIALGSLRK